MKAFSLTPSLPLSLSSLRLPPHSHLRRRFSHLHFFASNVPHSGISEGMDSISRIFNAILGDIAEEDA